MAKTPFRHRLSQPAYYRAVKNFKNTEAEAKLRRDAELITALRTGHWHDYFLLRGIVIGIQIARGLFYESRDWDWNRIEQQRIKQGQDTPAPYLAPHAAPLNHNDPNDS